MLGACHASLFPCSIRQTICRKGNVNVATDSSLFCRVARSCQLWFERLALSKWHVFSSRATSKMSMDRQGKLSSTKDWRNAEFNFRPQLPSLLSAVLEIAWDFSSYIVQIETNTVTCRGKGHETLWGPFNNCAAFYVHIQRQVCHNAGALSPQAFPPETACGLWDPEDPHHSPTLRSSSLVVIFFFSFHSFQLVKTSLNSSICKWLRCCIHVSKITCRMCYTVSTRVCCFTTFVVCIPLDCNPLTSESLKSAAPWNSFLPSPSRSNWKWPYCHSPCSSTKSSCY